MKHIPYSKRYPKATIYKWGFDIFGDPQITKREGYLVGHRISPYGDNPEAVVITYIRKYGRYTTDIYAGHFRYVYVLAGWNLFDPSGVSEFEKEIRRSQQFCLADYRLDLAEIKSYLRGVNVAKKKQCSVSRKQVLL